MASTYVHLSGRDVDGALLRLNGLKTHDEAPSEGFRALACTRCKGSSSPDAMFCSSCGMCLDAKTAIEIDNVRLQADKLMTELMKRPEVLEQMLKAVEQIKE